MMTIDAEHAASSPAPAGYVSDSVPARTLAYFRYAPLERVPWATAPIVWSAAEIFHACHLNWTLPGSAAFIATCVAYARASRRAARSEHLELDGPEVAAMLGVPGLWLTLATRIGPWPVIGSAKHDLITGSFAALYGLGPVWLRRHDAVQARAARRAMAEAELARLDAERQELNRRKQEWNTVAPLVSLNRSFLIDYEINQNGSETWEINTKGTRKLARNVANRELEAILAGEGMEVLGGKPRPENWVTAVADPGRMPHKLFITFRQKALISAADPASLIMHPMWSGELDLTLPGAEYFTDPAPSILTPFPIGINPETGQMMLVTLYDGNGARRILVVGATDSGKSSVLNNIRERVTACRDAILLQINLSKGTEDKWFAPLAEANALATTVGMDEAEVRAEKILALIKEEILLARPKARADGYQEHVPTETEPAFVVILDESDVTADDSSRRDFLGKIASKCRSEGVALIIATQRPIDKNVGGGSVRSSWSDIIYGKMRSRDLGHAGDTVPLPDVLDFGGSAAGVFGVTSFPPYEGMPVTMGRTFFWGRPALGLIELIKRRAAERQPYQLEPGLAHLAAQWAEITEAAPLAKTESVAAQASHSPLDALRARLSKLTEGARRARGDDAAQPAQTPSAPPGAPAAPAAQASPAQPQAPAEGKLPLADQNKLWGLLTTTPGGISARSPENGGPLQRVNPLPGAPADWSYETVRQQLQFWQSQRKVRLTGRGREFRWRPVPHVVPDPQPKTPVTDGLTDHESVMIAASWLLHAPDVATGRVKALQDVPLRAVDRATELIAHDPEYVRGELARIAAGGHQPPPPPLPDDDEDEDLDDDEDEDEDLDDDEDEDLDDDEDEAAP